MSSAPPSYSMKLLSCLLLLGWRSFRSALASIWRMRSRVTSNSCPTSSRVWSVCSPMPNLPAKHLFLPLGEGAEHLAHLVVEVFPDGRIRGDMTFLSSMKSPRWLSSSSPMGVSRGDGLLGDLHDLSDLLNGQLHGRRDFLGGGLPAEFLHEPARRADQLVHGLDHVHGDADGARLVGDGPRDGLPDPPRSVSAELVPALPFELVHGLHEADVPLPGSGRGTGAPGSCTSLRWRPRAAGSLQQARFWRTWRAPRLSHTRGAPFLRLSAETPHSASAFLVRLQALRYNFSISWRMSDLISSRRAAFLSSRSPARIFLKTSFS